MKNKKKFFISVFVLVIFLLNQGCTLPVIDLTKIFQDFKNHLEKMGKWRQYLEKINRIRLLMKETKALFFHVYNSVVAGDIITGKNFANYILNRPYIDDPENKDTWYFIWKSLKELTGYYPELRNYSFLYENRMYKNPRIKHFLDRLIEIEEEKVDDIENLTKFLTDMRKFDHKRSWQLKLLQNRADEYGLSGETGKLFALTANLNIEKCRIQMQVNLLLRVGFEYFLKRQVWDKEMEKMYANFHKNTPYNWSERK